ncbi:MAG: PIN domain-containing protein [Terriglobales bacterium]
MVLVDTSVWSLALRRKQTDLSAGEHALREALGKLIREGRAQIMGPVRQELLSGIREDASFRRLRDYLRAFDDPSLRVEDYEETARMNNLCRTRGIAGSPVDFLICAVAQLRNWPVFTADRAFGRYAKVLSLRLYCGESVDTCSFSIAYAPPNAPFTR